MKTIIIKDLARIEAHQLDSKAMAQVRGGWSLNPPGYDDGYSPRGSLPIHPDPGDRSIAYLENPAARDLPGLDWARAYPSIAQPGQLKFFAN